MQSTDTVLERIRGARDVLTRAERQIVAVLTENYPVSGLGSITRLAESAKVSTPTVARMVQKLGFEGFPDFQDAIRRDLEARMSNPIEKHAYWAERAPQRHILNRFTEKTSQNIRQTVAHLDPESFDASAALLADETRVVHITGGRITHALSDYFRLHLEVVRPGVRGVRSTDNAWPHRLLDMSHPDVLVVYDVRRYETGTLRLAEMAVERGLKIILITDQWQSPVSSLATHCLPCRIEAPSAWDSGMSIMLLSECLIAAVQELRWDATEARMQALEKVFDQSRTFRKFV